DRSPAVRTSELDLTAVRVRHLADDREAEAGAWHPARRARTVEALEHVRQVLIGDPGAVVADDHLAVLYLERNLSPGRAALAGAVEEVAHRSLDRRRDAAHHRFLQLRGEVHSRPVPPSTFDSVRRDEIEAHVLRLAALLLTARHLEQVANQDAHL